MEISLNLKETSTIDQHGNSPENQTIFVMNFLLCFLLTGFFLNGLQSAPTTITQRKPKQLYYDYLQTDDEFNNDELNLDNDYVDDNDISRTIQARPRIKPSNQFTSPIYYIRLPPQPYMFVPGLGYVSQPPSPPPQSSLSGLMNVPVNFISNGKPSTIYQWSGGLGGGFQTEPPPPPPPPSAKPQRPDSAIHRLPGQYMFNGKPEDIFILRDSYNSLYSDALTNFYP